MRQDMLKIQPPETKISLISFNVRFSSNVGWLWVHERRLYSVIVPQQRGGGADGPLVRRFSAGR